MACQGVVAPCLYMEILSIFPVYLEVIVIISILLCHIIDDNYDFILKRGTVLSSLAADVFFMTLHEPQMSQVFPI